MASDKEKYVPGKYEKLLANVLRDKLEKESFIGTMLALVVNQEEPEKNCKELYEYLQQKQNVTYDEIYEKTDEILGIYIDEDD